MYILMNESNDEIYCFVITLTKCMTITHVQKNGLTKCSSFTGVHGLNLWAELKEKGWVELRKPVVEWNDHDDDNVGLVR